MRRHGFKARERQAIVDAAIDYANYEANRQNGFAIPNEFARSLAQSAPIIKDEIARVMKESYKRFFDQVFE